MHPNVAGNDHCGDRLSIIAQPEGIMVGYSLGGDKSITCAIGLYAEDIESLEIRAINSGVVSQKCLL